MNGAGAGGEPTFVVMVGTDHHPFHRLVDWVDEAARRCPGHRFVVQHGHSKAPEVALGHPFLSSQRIGELLAGAVGVIVHGGPGTIMDARHAGHRPICVPRDPARGEHVDGHQQRFAALVGAEGLVTLAETEDDFHAAVERLVLADLSTSLVGSRDLDPVTAVTQAARRQLAEELDRLLGLRPHERPTRPRHRPGGQVPEPGVT